MKLHRLYRFVLLAATGGMVFQTTTSCSTQLVNSLGPAVQEAIISAVTSAINAYLNQFLYGTT